MKSICRICGASTIDCEQIVLDKMPLTDYFLTSRQDPEYIADITINRCKSCGMVSNRCDFDYSGYYRDYAYTSGHSAHTIKFMSELADACIEASKYSDHKNDGVPRVIEIGSGDGEQLRIFKALGCKVTGVEPSRYLSNVASQSGINTKTYLFDLNKSQELLTEYGFFDIVVSSYTFDHAQDPIDFLRGSHNLLQDDGILGIEIHDFNTVARRAEFCLIEHEHTIYLNAFDMFRLLRICGFEVISINPVAQSVARANSLLVIAKKRGEWLDSCLLQDSNEDRYATGLHLLLERINKVTDAIDTWIDSRNQPIVGYGAGGRGVMTLARLKNSAKFEAILDFSFDNRTVFMPKTHIPVVGPSGFNKYNKHEVLVFSFGYFDEICASLVSCGYDKNRITSLRQFLL